MDIGNAAVTGCYLSALFEYPNSEVVIYQAHGFGGSGEQGFAFDILQDFVPEALDLGFICVFRWRDLITQIMEFRPMFGNLMPDS